MHIKPFAAGIGAAVAAVLIGGGVNEVQSDLTSTMSAPTPAAKLSAIRIGSANQCDVRTHFVVNHAGNETINVSGHCADHAPTADDMRRLADPLVIPNYLVQAPASKRTIRRLHLHGPCTITKFRKHAGFTIMCSNGQYRLLP